MNYLYIEKHVVLPLEDKEIKATNQMLRWEHALK